MQLPIELLHDALPIYLVEVQSVAYTCIYTLCYIHLCQNGAILSEGVIQILLQYRILLITKYYKTYTNTGVFIFKNNHIIFHFLQLLFSRFPSSSCHILNFGPQLFLHLFYYVGIYIQWQSYYSSFCANLVWLSPFELVSQSEFWTSTVYSNKGFKSLFATGLK